MTSLVAAMLRFDPTRAWFRSLIDCPPGIHRSGYGLVDAWWSGDEKCRHTCCIGEHGCLLTYNGACKDADMALRELVFLRFIEPATRSEPVTGHTCRIVCHKISKIKAGVKWNERIHEPAYVYGFDPTSKLMTFFASE